MEGEEEGSMVCGGEGWAVRRSGGGSGNDSLRWRRRRQREGCTLVTRDQGKGRRQSRRRARRRHVVVWRRWRRRRRQLVSFLEQPLEREDTPFFPQMMARVCGGVPSPLIEPIVGRERKGPT